MSELHEAIRRARRVVVLTGAGISKESGIPTFREAQTGIWARFRPEELASPEAFARDPERVWSWYRARRDQALATEPNAGHRALVELAGMVPELHVITQNVDGLHARAGSEDVTELHGNLHRVRCITCNTRQPWPTDEASRRCACGGALRPDIVWFGEMLDEAVLARAFELSQGADVFFSIGTSALVQPAAGLPLFAKRAVLVEVNPDATPLRSCDSHDTSSRRSLSDFARYSFRESASTALPKLLDALRS
ncbi:MAG TPA: NAD-dependent deacylase [Labilithrix sp.]|nr:NAD-dependent deacylase [Labilithrix sp.]